jgi:hypothetical protein
MAGEVMNETFHRLVRYGLTEGQATALARIVTLPRNASDAVVEIAVIAALVSVKQAVDGDAEVEYLGGQRRDTLRQRTH